VKDSQYVQAEGSQMRKNVALAVSAVIAAGLLAGCGSSEKSETSSPVVELPESGLGPNDTGANGLALLPDEAAEGVCFESFHFFLDSRDPATYEYSEDNAVNGLTQKALLVQEMWNEIKWMDGKFGTTFAEFALDMGQAAIGQLDSYESEQWCKGRSMRVNDGSP
jgi:hypothetical protein